MATVTGSITSTAALQVIGSNPGRKSIQVCNVGSAVMWIWPGALSPATSAYELPALATGTTTCLTPPTGANGPNGSTSRQFLEWRRVPVGQRCHKCPGVVAGT